MSWDFNLPFHRMMEQAKQQYTSDFFMEIFRGGGGTDPLPGWKTKLYRAQTLEGQKKRNQKLSIQVHFRNQRRLHVQHVRFHLICKKGLINEDTLIKCTFNTMVGISSINEIFHGGKSYN
jgi:hypothetical protein